MRLLVAFVLTLCAAAPVLAENPIVRDKFTADPAALVHDGRVYLYTGHDEATPRDRFFVMRDWWCYSSDDMVNWRDEGSPLSVKAFDWARGDAWASQVIERDGKFYWYVTVRHRTIEGFSIGVAVAEKPTGPFRDARGSALVSNDMTRGPIKNGREMDWDDLDPTVIVDDDGQAYLFWGNTQCYYAKLKPNMIELDGAIEKIDLPKFTEAPWIHKREGLYYLSYAYDFPEKIAYATAEKVTGPWTFRGVINERVPNSPTNHQSIVESNKRWYFFYHNAALPGGGEHRRSVCVEELFYNDDGRIRPITQDPRGLTMNDPETQLFPLGSVRLLDGSPFATAQERDRQYLLAHDVDRLLAPFRREAGLPAKAKPYGNWESQGLDGHSAGHYLSALAMMYASTGDAELKRRLDYMVAQLAECQRANGNGYVGGVPKSQELWKSVAAGELKVTGFGLNDRWVPWYNLHKTFAGLRDSHLVAGNEQAKDVLIALADWCVELTSKVSDVQMQEMLRAEHGGMNEVLADVHAITKDEKYVEAARRFSHQAILDPLAEGRDDLTGKHANTQIPKVIGFQRIAELSSDRGESGRFARAARFFWDTITRRRSVAIGGNSVNEHFHPPDNFRPMIEDRTGPETCNTYNMLRLTEALFQHHPRAEHADYYERALYNHILAAQHPEHGGLVYFTPMRPRHYRVYSQAEQAFWCCVGSGFENHAKYGQFIYAHGGDDRLYVNLFVASQLDWAERGLVLRQETNFPDEPRTRLTLKLRSPATFSMRLRHPAWVKRGDMKVSVNGEPQAIESSPSSYIELKREWRDGDVVEVELPMHLEAEPLPDNSNFVALKYGPVVLAAATGTEQTPGLRAGDGRGDHVAPGPLLPLHGAPTLVVPDPSKVAEQFEPVPGAPLTFRAAASDTIRPEQQYGDLKLVPFFRLHDARYVLYWPLATPENYAAERERLAAAERERLALETATVDRVEPGQQQSEVEHQFAGDRTNNGTFRDRSWRDAHGWFSYELRVPTEMPSELMVTYWGGDRGRHFDVLVDGKLLEAVRLDGRYDGRFFDARYSVPPEARRDGKVTLRFQAKPGSIAGGVYDVRVLRRSAEP